MKNRLFEQGLRYRWALVIARFLILISGFKIAAAFKPSGILIATAGFSAMSSRRRHREKGATLLLRGVESFNIIAPGTMEAVQCDFGTMISPSMYENSPCGSCAGRPSTATTRSTTWTASARCVSWTCSPSCPSSTASSGTPSRVKKSRIRSLLTKKSVTTACRFTSTAGTSRRSTTRSRYSRHSARTDFRWRSPASRHARKQKGHYVRSRRTAE